MGDLSREELIKVVAKRVAIPGLSQSRSIPEDDKESVEDYLKRGGVITEIESRYVHPNTLLESHADLLGIKLEHGNDNTV